MSNFYNYNQIIKYSNLERGLGASTFDIQLKEEEIYERDVHLNPCRLLWSLYKIEENIPDEEFAKKLVAKPEQTSAAKFIDYSNNISKIITKNIQLSKDKSPSHLPKEISKKSTLFVSKSDEMIDFISSIKETKQDKQDREDKQKRELINKLKNQVSQKCTTDTLLNTNNKIAISIISQMKSIPTESTEENQEDVKKGITRDFFNKSILNYSLIGYEGINGTLRGIIKNPSDETINDIVNLDLIFDKYGVSSVSNEKGMRLYRGMKKVYYLDKGQYKETERVGDLKVGDVITDKGFVSSSLDINTSLGGFFGGENKSDETKSCCCIFTFVYPPHLPFIPMADFNIEGIIEKEEAKQQQTAFGFTETELLLPRNFNLKIIKKDLVPELFNLDTKKPKKFINLTIVECEVVFKIDKNTDKNFLENLKKTNSHITISALLYKNIIRQRNENLSSETKKKYAEMYERKIIKFKIGGQAWFNDPNNKNDTISFVYKFPISKKGGGEYDKYIKYKSKYIALKNKLDGGNNNTINNNTINNDTINIDKKNIVTELSFPLKTLVNLLISISIEQKCCMNDLQNLNTVNDFQKNFIREISNKFKEFKENTQSFFIGTKNVSSWSNIIEKKYADILTELNNIINFDEINELTLSLNQLFAVETTKKKKIESDINKLILEKLKRMHEYIVSTIWPISEGIVNEYIKFMQNSLTYVKEQKYPFYNLKQKLRPEYYPKLEKSNAFVNNCIKCGMKENSFVCNHVIKSNLLGGATKSDQDIEVETVNITCAPKKNVVDEKQKQTSNIINAPILKTNDKLNIIIKCCNMALGPASCVKQFSINFILPIITYYKDISNMLKMTITQDKELYKSQSYITLYNEIQESLNKIISSLTKSLNEIADINENIKKHNNELQKNIQTKTSSSPDKKSAIFSGLFKSKSTTSSKPTINYGPIDI